MAGRRLGERRRRLRVEGCDMRRVKHGLEGVEHDGFHSLDKDSRA